MKYMLLALLALPLCGQNEVPRPLFPRMTEFLNLTHPQAMAMSLNNDAYNGFLMEKTQRIWQVQSEIAVETDSEPLDASALGIRYAEIEAICRQLRDSANDLQKQNLALLTDAQKTKMKALEEALQLIPVLEEAQMTNLLAPWTTAPSGLSVTGKIYGGIGFATSAGVYGCSGSRGVVAYGAILTGARPAPPSAPLNNTRAR
jgi:hypothetical protein